MHWLPAALPGHAEGGETKKHFNMGGEKSMRASCSCVRHFLWKDLTFHYLVSLQTSRHKSISIHLRTVAERSWKNQLCIEPRLSTTCSFKSKPSLLKLCVTTGPYHLVRGVIRLELLMGWVLHVDWVVSDDGGDRGVVAHHCLCTLFTIKLQESLQGGIQQIRPISFSHNIRSKSPPFFIL